MGDLTVKIDDGSFSRALHDFAVTFKRDAKDVFKQQSKLIIRNVIDLTPPSGRSKGTAAKKAGEKQVEKDLAALFVGVRLKGKRREQWPDVAAIHATRFSRKSGKRLTRGQKAAYYVDQSKLKTLLTKLKAQVGKLASGWVAAFVRLGGSVPVWIARHGASRGTVELVLEGNNLHLKASNITQQGAPNSELLRRVNAAVKRQEDNMVRQVRDRLEKRARRF